MPTKVERASNADRVRYALARVTWRARGEKIRRLKAQERRGTKPTHNEPWGWLIFKALQTPFRSFHKIAYIAVSEHARYSDTRISGSTRTGVETEAETKQTCALFLSASSAL
jgi:hypothetical protein